MANKDVEIVVSADTKQAEMVVQDSLGRAAKTVGQKTERSIAKGVEKGAKKGGNALNQMANNFKKKFTGPAFAQLFAANIASKLVLGTLNKLGQLFDEAATNASQFGLRVAEINTLLDESNALSSKQIQSLKSISALYGKDLLNTSRAYYNIISAGITDSANSIELLETATKAGIVGVTDTNTAVRSLLSSLNAYGEENISAAEAADILFATVRFGRTTFENLSNSIGDAIPIAAQLGISLGEVGGFLAANTRITGNTSKATTQLRQLLVSIQAPTEGAKKTIALLNKALGDNAIEFSASALKAKGLVKFIRDLDRATSGFKDQNEIIRKLFPNVRALLGFTSVIGERFESFAQATEDVQTNQGELNKRLSDVNNTFSRQADILGQNVLMKLTEFATLLQDLVLPTLKSINSVFEEGLTNSFFNFVQAAASLSPALVPVIPALRAYNEHLKKIEEQKSYVGVESLTESFNDLAQVGAKDTIDEIMQGLTGFTDSTIPILTRSPAAELKNLFGTGDGTAKTETEERIQTEHERLQGLLQDYGFTLDAVREMSQDMINPFKLLTDGATGAFDTFANVSKQYGQTMKQFSTSVKKNIMDGAARSMSAGFQAMGAALANGENAFKAAGQAILGAFGNTVSQLGQGFVLEGVARSLRPGDPTGVPLIAAGAAMQVFGSFLSSKYGGGGASGPGTGGGGGAQPSIASPFNPEELGDREPQTRVNITVQGDILNEQASGERLTELLNTAFNQTGTIVEQGIA